MSDFKRAAAFEEAIRDSGTERVVETRFGPALFNETYRELWLLNVLRVERPGVAAGDEIASEAERVQAGLPHRRVLILGDVDWPKELYHRLGFEEVGAEWAFLRSPGRE
jgi:hypothetical protein